MQDETTKGEKYLSIVFISVCFFISVFLVNPISHKPWFFGFYMSVNCRLQTLSVWTSLKFVIWERVNVIVVGVVALRVYLMCIAG